MIGRHKYNHLKNLGIEKLSDFEKQQMREFESDKGLSAEQMESIKNYFDSIGKNKIDVPEFANANISQIYTWFKNFYKIEYDVEFDKNVNNGEPYVLVYTLLCYLFKHEKFYESPIINQKINKVDIRKGLLIIGGYGVGKTSIIKTLHEMLKQACEPIKYVKDENNNLQPVPRYKPFFKFRTANGIVSEYESISKMNDKKTFWKQYSKGTIYFDDVMTEREASNFGKVNVFKDMFENRSITRAKTLVSMNYVNGNLKDTLEEFKNRYGPRNFDRLFNMFNIIELKGESLRK